MQLVTSFDGCDFVDACTTCRLYAGNQSAGGVAKSIACSSMAVDECALRVKNVVENFSLDFLWIECCGLDESFRSITVCTKVVCGACKRMVEIALLRVPARLFLGAGNVLRAVLTT